MHNTLQPCFEASRFSLHINSKTLPLSEEFPYLGRTISYNNKYWALVYLNLRKSQRLWGMISRVLEMTGAKVRYRGEMYKAVAQQFLLYRSESWVVTGDILKVLTAFHHQLAQRITVMTAKRGACEEWEYPAVEEVMESTVLQPIRVYIKRRQKNIAERVDCWPVYAFCTEAERMLGTNRMVRWWDQDAIN